MRPARSTRSRGRSLGGLAAAWIAFAATAFSSPARQTGPGGAGALGDLGDLGSLAPRARAARLEVLAARGPSAAAGVFDGFDSAPRAARRGRAWLLFVAGGPAEIEGALSRLSDPDPGVRRELMRFLARPDLGAARLTERAAALVELGIKDPDPELRAAAVRTLLELDRPETLGVLETRLDEFATPERHEAARELAGRARVRERLLARFVAAWPEECLPFDNALAARLLRELARAMADLPALAADARARGALAAALRHPDGAVRRAGVEALEALVARLELHGEVERSSRVLTLLAADGIEPSGLAFQRARLELRHGVEFANARTIAEALARECAGLGVESRIRRARAELLRAQAAFATGDEVVAREALVEARRAANSLAAERTDLGLALGGATHVVALELEALADLAELVLDLAPEAVREGPRVGDVEPLLEREARHVAAARELHRALLELQRAGWRTGADAASSFDALLESELSPFALVLDNARAPAWPRRRSLALRERLCAVLGRVAPAEFPGFAAPDAEHGDPTADPARLAALKSVQLARLDLVQRDFNELSGRMLRAALEDPCGADPEMAERAAMLYFERQDAIDGLRDEGEQGRATLAELRVVSTSALDLARAWRDEGRPEKARDLLERMRSDLDRSGAGARFVWGLELAAEIEMALGTTWGDGGDPARAEAELLRAVERLEQLEELVKERKLGPGLVRRLKNVRSSALVSLAVNANVKQGDPKQALAYFERAWELRQDEFMRVLRACYSARAGRHDAARAILREVTPSPLAHYNMACTYALCGDTELALDFLRREFEENQISPGAAAKQRAWSRGDPDLASLRGDPRFEALVGK